MVQSTHMEDMIAEQHQLKRQQNYTRTILLQCLAIIVLYIIPTATWQAGRLGELLKPPDYWHNFRINR